MVRGSTDDRGGRRHAACLPRDTYGASCLERHIDIKGNLWGAVVRDDRGWVDMVTVAADEGDASCRLRAVRLVPQKTILEEGS